MHRAERDRSDWSVAEGASDRRAAAVHFLNLLLALGDFLAASRDARLAIAGRETPRQRPDEVIAI